MTLSQAPLPQEILSSIVNCGSLSQHDLCMLSLASAPLRHEAQRRLFRDPGQHQLDVYHEPRASRTVAAREFLDAVTTSPDRLAPMVRRYHITLFWYAFRERYHNDMKSLQNRHFNCLAKALPLMVNLKDLAYCEVLGEVLHQDGNTEAPPAIWPALKRCLFALNDFRCSYVGANRRKDLAAFLQRQKGLQNLWVAEVANTSKTSKTTLPQKSTFKDTCPALLSLGGMPELVIAMVSDRQGLQHISWEKNDYATDIKFSPALFSSTGTTKVEFLESLRCGPSIHVISKVFKNLVVLKTCEKEVIHKSHIFKNMPRLRVLVYSDDESIPSSLVRREDEIIRRVFSHSLSLEYVECHRHYGREPGKKFLVDRDERSITVYVVPRTVPLANTEGRQALLERLSQKIDHTHSFLRTFTMA